jgi:pimeloyl-ACP methyl ester carboxylesterase
MPINQRTRPEDLAEKASITAATDWMFDQESLDRWMILEFRALYTDPSTSATIPHDFDGTRYNQWKVTEPTIRASLGEWDVTSILPSIDAPVLLVYCRESILGLEVPATYERLMPDARLVWVDGGHTPPAEDPDAFAAAVRSFLKES